MKQMIKTEQLTKIYGENTVVSQVNLTLEKGDIYGLIGKNGAGKTTLFKMIMGLSEPTSGSLMIEGSLTNQEASLSRHNIGFMIGAQFFPFLGAYQNIDYFRTLKGITDKKETDRVLKIVGLENVRKPFKTFSLGMKQRLGIANALLGNPDIVILDEPINGLDPEGIQDVRTIIKEMNEQHGLTFIISSHILSELDLVCNKFGFIDQGVLIKELDYQTLHEHTGKSLLIEVDKVPEASVLLENELNIHEYKIGSNNSIIVENFEGDQHLIAKCLVNHDIKVYQLAKQEITLEAYFMELIGGKTNA